MLRIVTICFVVVLLTACSEQKQSGRYNPKAIELNNRACDMMSRFQHDSALILFDKAIELDETYYLPHANKIGIFTQRGEYDKALYESDMVVKKEPDLAEGWASGGMLYERQGNVEKAMMYYERSIEIFDDRISNPDKADDIRANRLNRAFSFILLGRESEGRDEMRKMKAEDPDNPDNMVIDELLKVNKQDYIREILNDKNLLHQQEPDSLTQEQIGIQIIGIVQEEFEIIEHGDTTTYLKKLYDGLEGKKITYNSNVIEKVEATIQFDFAFLQYTIDDNPAFPLSYTLQSSWKTIKSENGKILIPDFNGNSKNLPVYKILGFRNNTELANWVARQDFEKLKQESLKVQTEFYNALINEKSEYENCCPEYIEQAKSYLSKRENEFKTVDDLYLELFYKKMTIELNGSLINGKEFRSVIIEKE